MKIEEIEIILVEDNPDDAFFTIRAFKSANSHYKIIHLINGEDAVNFFFHNSNFPAHHFTNHSKLILLDLHLPMVDGIEILKMLKETKETATIPVVVLTASDDDPLMKKCLEMGAASYIIKPVTFEGFTKVVNEINNKWCS